MSKIITSDINKQVEYLVDKVSPEQYASGMKYIYMHDMYKSKTNSVDGYVFVFSKLMPKDDVYLGYSMKMQDEIS